MRGYRVPYPIKLIYTSNIPIMFLVAFFANFYLFSQVLDRMYSGNFIVRIIGKWMDNEISGGATPVGGLVYYFFPPHSLYEIFSDPIRTIFYWAFVLGVCASVSRRFIDHSG